jgi:hypothetical protein
VRKSHSYIDADDARIIDTLSPRCRGPSWGRDTIAAGMVIELRKRDESMFIY